jgi:Tyrosine phosphatase family
MALAVVVVVVLRNERPGLHIAIEGAVLDYNFRDVGTSMNECLQGVDLPVRFREGVLLRSNQWFSGWSCKEVGSPDAIVSLNFKPDRRWDYFCKGAGDKILVGAHGDQDDELNDIEFVATWEDAQRRSAICGNISLIIESVNSGKRTLFHCEAGRDRTGAVAGLLTALSFEQNGVALDHKSLSAIECDYRKSKSLVPGKYGRVEAFIGEIVTRYRGVSAFLVEQCDLDEVQLREFALRIGGAI